MKRCTALLFALALAIGSLAAQADLFGSWVGSMIFDDGELPVRVRLTEGGAILDLPSQELYGYPSTRTAMSPQGFEAWFRFGTSTLNLVAVRSATGLAGTFGNGQAGGKLALLRDTARPDEGSVRHVAQAAGAKLAGTLMLPELAAGAKAPLVILHAGLGAADRDGNNFNIKGKNDALRMLAASLAAAGIASYRYDKRGSGESFWLVPDESKLSPDAWVSDLVAIAESFGADSRFSGVWLFGLNDGAVVAAAAANRLKAGKGLIVACSAASSVYDSYVEAIEEAPEAERAEGRAILAALKAGRTVPNPGAFYASAFRPGFQPYLIQMFRYDLLASLTAFRGPVLVLQGDRDMQATYMDFTRIMQAQPAARGVVIPEMNHMLKLVPPDVDENNRAFSDPLYPLPLELAEEIAGFVLGPARR